MLDGQYLYLEVVLILAWGMVVDQSGSAEGQQPCGLLTRSPRREKLTLVHSIELGTEIGQVSHILLHLIDSVLGYGGTVRAVDCGDVGSPGYIANPNPRFLSIEYSPQAVLLKCRVNPGHIYRLSGAERLDQDPWMDLGIHSAFECILFLEHEGINSQSNCYYRLEEVQ